MSYRAKPLAGRQDDQPGLAGTAGHCWSLLVLPPPSDQGLGWSEQEDVLLQQVCLLTSHSSPLTFLPHYLSHKLTGHCCACQTETVNYRVGQKYEQ